MEDSEARELITSAVGQYVDYDAMAEVKALEDEVTARFRRHVATFDTGALHGKALEQLMRRRVIIDGALS